MRTPTVAPAPAPEPGPRSNPQWTWPGNSPQPQPDAAPVIPFPPVTASGVLLSDPVPPAPLGDRVLRLDALRRLLDFDEEIEAVAVGLIEAAKDCLGKGAPQRPLDLCGALLNYSDAVFATMGNLRGLVQDQFDGERPRPIGGAKTLSIAPSSLPGRRGRTNKNNKHTQASSMSVKQENELKS